MKLKNKIKKTAISIAILSCLAIQACGGGGGDDGGSGSGSGSIINNETSKFQGNYSVSSGEIPVTFSVDEFGDINDCTVNSAIINCSGKVTSDGSLVLNIDDNAGTSINANGKISGNGAVTGNYLGFSEGDDIKGEFAGQKKNENPEGGGGNADVCSNLKYDGDTSNIQIYAFDELAQSAQCIYRSTGNAEALNAGNGYCSVLDGLLKTLSTNPFKPKYCSGDKMIQ